jgi:hypothetical protein
MSILPLIDGFVQDIRMPVDLDHVLALRGPEIEEIIEIFEVSKGLHSPENGDAEKHGVAEEWMQARSFMK